MVPHRIAATVLTAFALSLGCSATTTDDASDPNNPGGKADDTTSDLCPAEVGLNAAAGTAKRCFDTANGQFVATECCADLCAGAEIRTQSNGDRCAWVGEPGLPGATQGQFAPSTCCELNEGLACGRAEGEAGDCSDASTGRGVADVCCEPQPQECHPSMALSIDLCVFDQLASLSDEGEPLPNLLAVFDTCTTEFDALAVEIDARCEFQPELPFCGIDFEDVAAGFVAPCAESMRHGYDCALGQSFSSMLEQTHITLIDSNTLTVTEGAAASTLTQSQIVAAVGEGVDESPTIETAFDMVDEGLVNVLEVFDLSSNRSYSVVEFGAGDNSVGAIFASGTATMVGIISDDDISGLGSFTAACDAPIGAGGNLCGTNDDCAAGFRCTGAVENDSASQSPIGLCIDQGFGDGSFNDCTELRNCGEGGYCSGLSFMETGFCANAWMFGHRSSDQTLDVPDGESARSDVLIYGQATVPMDLELTLDLFHDTDTQQLQVELVIPGPSDGDDVDRARVIAWPRDGVTTGHPTGGRVKFAVPAFGDETINGTWTVIVTDTQGNGSTGGIFGWELEYSSRFD